VQQLPQELKERLQELVSVSAHPDGEFVLTMEEENSGFHAKESGKLRRVLDLLDNAGIPLSAIETHEASLETLFLQLTGRSLRD
jgi:hypothetical protein